MRGERAITSATMLGWLDLQGCRLSDEARRAPPELRNADRNGDPNGTPPPMKAMRGVAAASPSTPTRRRSRIFALAQVISVGRRER